MRDRKNLSLIIALLVLTLLVFYPLIGHQFLNYDDDDYVTANRRVALGFTADNLFWALSSRDLASNWHPLTWLSHMLDAELFGLKPWGHHLTNILLHLANTIALYLVLSRITGSLLKSALAAALFAVHPLHVEPVAWISERKELLAAFFMLLTLASYLRYVRKPCIQSYLPVVIAFALGLMSKPMVVTLPLILLLFDYWPLGRSVREKNFKLIMEKGPLLLLSIATSIMAYTSQDRAGSIRSLLEISLSSRLANAFWSYFAYIYKAAWPVKLAVFYPYFEWKFPWTIFSAAVFSLLGATYFLMRQTSRPYLIVGWTSYVISLLPVIGLVQVGSQAMADRYTYLPLIGIFLMLSWFMPEFIFKKNVGAAMTLLISLTPLAMLSLAGHVQVGYWRDSLSLFKHALEVTDKNWMAHNNYAVALEEAGRPNEASIHFIKAAAIAPNYAEPVYNLGVLSARWGQLSQAESYLRRAIMLDPNHFKARNNLAGVLTSQNRTEEAIAELKYLIAVKPDYEPAYRNLDMILSRQGKPREAEIYSPNR